MGTELATPTALSEVFVILGEENFYQALDAARDLAARRQGLWR
jgi:hypothetical protein